MQIWAHLTSQCEVSETQATIKAHGPLVSICDYYKGTEILIWGWPPIRCLS